MGTKSNRNETITLESEKGLLPLRTNENIAVGNAEDETERETEREETTRNNLDNQNRDEMAVVPKCCPGSVSFPYLFASSLVKFAIYIHKLFQDSSAVHTYYTEGNTLYMTLSVAALASPTLLYVVYLLCSKFAKSRRGLECAEWFTGMINGILLIPWQIKGRADVLHFTSHRICASRRPTHEEGDHVETLNRQASVLEFFEEFYAGFLQLVLQLYIFILTLSAVDKINSQKPLIGETVASILALIATVKAVKRRDDGILTGFLSMTGWFCFFASRFVAMSLAASVIHHWIGVVCAIHVIVVTVWISRFAWQSHELPTEDEPSPTPLTCRQRTSIFFLVLSMFGIPSLTYWPVMFQMKERKRPFIFILICALENVASFLTWYFGRKMSDNKNHEELTIPDYACLAVLFGGLVVGSLCLTFYIVCKPKYTDQVVMYEMKVENANSYGIFYDFCDATFKLPRTDKIGINLHRIRNER